jgi:Protein of unknown function (DUF1353)
MDEIRPNGRAPGFYVPGTDHPARWLLERCGDAEYLLTEPVEYVDDAHWSYVIAANRSRTDFASIPWFLTWLVPRDGTHTPAAILHDAFIGGIRGTDYETNHPGGVSDEHADYLFREAMEQASVGIVRRWMMWAAVSLRTLSRSRDGTRPNLVKVIPLGIVVVCATVLSALMELDVPDFEQNGWHLPWFGDLPWYEEIWHGLVAVAMCAIACSLLITLILRRTRALGVGAITGGIIGFFGLPMLASAIGWAGYWVLEYLVTQLVERRSPSTPATPDT